jgi:hypothetical protein
MIISFIQECETNDDGLVITVVPNDHSFVMLTVFISFSLRIIWIWIIQSINTFQNYSFF